MLFGTQDKDFFPVDFVEKFNLLKEIGFDAFEVDGSVLVQNVEKIKEAIEKTGVKVTSACGGYSGWIGDFNEEKRKKGIEDLRQIIKALKEVGGTGVVVPAAWGMFTFRLPPMTPPRDKKGDREAIHKSLAELDKVAAENDLYIYLEPLNRYQDHMINLVSEAREIIEEGNYSNVKIIADFYHMNIEEDDISETLTKNKDLVKHIHVADNHRYQPGTGSIDFKKHLQTLVNNGYDGALIYEGRVRGENLLEVYKESIKYLRNCL